MEDYTACSGTLWPNPGGDPYNNYNQHNYDKLNWKIDFNKPPKRRFTMKKIIFGAVLAVVGLSGMSYGTGAFSYLQTIWNQTTEAIADEIPVEFQIERAKTIMTQLDPEIKSTLTAVARKEIEKEEIEVRLADARERADNQKQELMATDEISDKTRILYVSHKTNQSTVNSLEQLNELKGQTILAGKKKLLQLSQARKALEVTIEELEVRNETLKLIQNERGTFEDSAILSEVQDIINSLSTRIGVAEKLLDIESTINQEAAADTGLDDEIAAFIGTNKTDEQIAANEL